MKKLSDEMRKEYLENAGTRCPFCNSDNITAGDWDFGIGENWSRVYCNICEERWTDVYKLAGIEQYE